MIDPAAVPGVPGKFPWGMYWITLVVILLVAIWPAVSVYAAHLIAGANDCRIDEETVRPCVISGQNFGEALHTMGVMGWYLLGTIPLGVFGFLAWMRTLFAHRSTWRAGRRAG